MTYEIIGLTLIVPLVVFVYMTASFVFSQYLRRTDFVDAYWGLGFVLLALFTFLTTHNPGILSTVTTLFVIIWGTRLSLHISKRLEVSKEDERYVKIKKSWKVNPALNEYFRIFLLQGLLMYLISLPVLIINYFGGKGNNLFFYLGAIVWIIGFIFEAVSDRQLRNFIKNKKGKGKKIMDEGLWKYSRHPNYFGEITMWWGIFILSISTHFWVLTIVSPILITFLLVKVSGIPLLEERYEKDEDYLKYKKKTSILFPLPPKK